jgi:hypothetical protein
MGFFAVVHPSENSRAFSVKKCHLNFFAIRPSSGAELSFSLDVGLLLRNTDPRRADCEAEILVVIPLAASLQAFSDLGSNLLDPKIAANIFGEPVTIDNRKCITLRSFKEDPEGKVPPSGKFRVFPVAADLVKREESLSGADASVWKIRISFSDGIDTYVRMRFALESPGRLMQTIRSDSSSRAALVDFRVSDVRGADSNGTWDSLEARMAEVESLNFFLITPIDFHMFSSSPSLKYTRLLEPMVWRKYLKRAELETLVAYHWSKDSSITPEKPFHIFGRLETRSRGMSFSDLVRVGFVCVVASFFVMGTVSVCGRVTIRSALEWAREHLLVVILSALVAVVGVLVFVKKYVELVEFYARKRNDIKAWRAKRKSIANASRD